MPKRIIKVNSKGAKRRKLVCGPGRKAVVRDGRAVCVPITGSEKAKNKRSAKKTVRTKKSLGSGATKRAIRLRGKAIKKRRAMGL